MYIEILIIAIIVFGLLILNTRIDTTRLYKENQGLFDLLKEKGNIIIETDDEKRELLELKKIEIEVKDVRKYGRVTLIFLTKSA